MNAAAPALPTPARIGIGGPVGSGKTALIEKLITVF
jgi:Ni2+-binding GTPase involved in maturation of urease and hydrogenase